MSLASLLIPAVSGILSKVIPDKDAREAAAHEIATLAEKQAHDQIMAQVEVNKKEAAHKSLFVAGWRPFIGWVCGSAMAFNFIGLPIIEAVAATAGHATEIDPLELSTMMPVLLGLLGLGGMRSYEKRHGVAREK